MRLPCFFESLLFVVHVAATEIYPTTSRRGSVCWPHTSSLVDFSIKPAQVDFASVGPRLQWIASAYRNPMTLNSGYRGNVASAVDWYDGNDAQQSTSILSLTLSSGLFKARGYP
ncbi:hypothetical protein DFH09DRAFT_240814 [Mycena vulgaris]|nr:hypothetical protein DFH09DRAFT_240814 [Mycena vulgaris]